MNDDEIFLRDFPDVYDDISLASLIRQNPKLDSYYIACAASPKRRKWFLELFGETRHLLDRKFCSQAKINFSSASWEMYLGYYLISLNLDVTSNDSGPDFRIKDDPSINIEAVCAQTGTTRFAVPPIQYGHVSDIPTEQMKLRILNSLNEKSEKFLDYLSNQVIKSDDINVIALNTGSLAYPEGSTPLIIRSCFGDSGNAVQKDSSFVSCDFFLNKNPHISAIIYSPSLVLEFRQNQNDMIIVHNPAAKNPLVGSIF